MYCGIFCEVVCGDFVVVCGSLRWFAVFQWTGAKRLVLSSGKYNFIGVSFVFTRSIYPHHIKKFTHIKELIHNEM